MKRLIARIRKWRLDKFVSTLPPFAQRDPEWLLEAFRRDIGREFNPFDASDRDIICTGLTLAQIHALPILFGKRGQ